MLGDVCASEHMVIASEHLALTPPAPTTGTRASRNTTYYDDTFGIILPPDRNCSVVCVAILREVFRHACCASEMREWRGRGMEMRVIPPATDMTLHHMCVHAGVSKGSHTQLVVEHVGLRRVFCGQDPPSKAWPCVWQ